MNQPIHRLSELSFKYLKQELSNEESIELEGFLNQSEENRQFFNELTNSGRLSQDLELIYKSDSDAVWKSIVNANPQLKRGKLIALFRPTLKYAAAVILIAALVGYWFFRRNNDSMPVTQKEKTPIINDVAPGQFKAKLTLADGSVVVLDSFSSSKMLQQGSTTVYTRDGQLIYEEKGKGQEVLYNMLTTAKGETFGMVLSDGSKVWLNSQSSLRYPVAFTGNERRVEITGEAYFEVTPSISQTKRPFIVNVNGIQVEVLGTHFNINAYNDEWEIKTTLLEGKVKVSKGGSLTVLNPGQQARLHKETQHLNKLDDVDVDEAVAWRFGNFQFNEADLQTVLRQLARWYDVDVVYEGTVSPRKFNGKMPRSLRLSQVLSILETNNVHFKIQGKKIMVSTQ